MHIGIDIGGTNTDAVMVDSHGKIAASIKVPTTTSIEEGVMNALSQLPKQVVTRICIGTTHAINAILQCRGLYRVGVIRLFGSRPETLPTCIAWPSTLRKAIYVDTITVDGGFECDGRPITPFDRQQVREAARQLQDRGAESLAIVGAFSPLHSSQEEEVAEILQGIPVTLSHYIGGIGLIERENSAILNAALKKVMTTGFTQLVKVIQQLGYDCPIYISQNNGSIITLEQALTNPILTLSAGPTNSFVGAGRLTKLKNAIIVDIGGTSTDVGIIKNGFPRRCLLNSMVGGVALNFPTPDVLSVALGGGSHINGSKIGPESCAKDLFQQGISFGGSQLTLTDIAIAMNQIQIPHAKKSDISFDQCEGLMKRVVETIDKLVVRLEPRSGDLPVILVGGGASLIPQHLLSHRYQIPDYAHVANAFGAALGEVSATIDTIVCLDEREKVLDELRNQVLAKAGVGARLVDVQVIPYHYMPGNKARVVMLAAK